MIETEYFYSPEMEKLEAEHFEKELISPQIQVLPCKYRSRDRCCDSIACHVDYFVACCFDLTDFVILCAVISVGAV